MRSYNIKNHYLLTKSVTLEGAVHLFLDETVSLVILPAQNVRVSLRARAKK